MLKGKSIALILAMMLVLTGAQTEGCDAIEAVSVEEKKEMTRGIKFSENEIWMIDQTSGDVVSGSFDPLTANDAFLAISVPYDSKKFDLDSLQLDAQKDYYVRFRGVTNTGAKGRFGRTLEYSSKPTLDSRPIVALQLGSAYTLTTTTSALTFGTVVHDPWSAWSANTFTAPRSGLYKIDIAMQVKVVTPHTTQNITVRTYLDDGTTVALVLNQIVMQELRDGDIVPFSGFVFKHLDKDQEIQIQVNKNNVNGSHALEGISSVGIEYLANQ